MQRIASIVVLVFAIVATSSALECYISYSNGTTTTVTTPEENVCISYKFKCTTEEPSCTSEQQQSGYRKWGYMYGTQETCDTMKTTPILGFTEVSCCNTDLCNDPAKNFGSIIAPSIALLLGAVALGL